MLSTKCKLNLKGDWISNVCLFCIWVISFGIFYSSINFSVNFMILFYLKLNIILLFICSRFLLSFYFMIYFMILFIIRKMFRLCHFRLLRLNRVARNMTEHYFWTKMPNHLGICQRLVLLCQIVDQHLTFWIFSTQIFIVNASVCNTINSKEGFSFPHIPFLKLRHSDWGNKKS